MPAMKPSNDIVTCQMRRTTLLVRCVSLGPRQSAFVVIAGRRPVPGVPESHRGLPARARTGVEVTAEGSRRRPPQVLNGTTVLWRQYGGHTIGGRPADCCAAPTNRSAYALARLDMARVI